MFIISNCSHSQTELVIYSLFSVCLDDVSDDSAIDTGCSADKPFCNGNGGPGTECFKCQDTAPDGDTDFGCQLGNGICVVTRLGDFGNECAACVNSEDQTLGADIADLGCEDTDINDDGFNVCAASCIG